MTGRGWILALAVFAGVLLGVFGSQVLGAQSDAEVPVQDEELLRQELTTVEGTEVAMVRARLAPGAAMANEPTIEHPVEEFVYVVEGTATLTREGEEPIEFEAGESWYNGFEQAHTLANESSSEPLTVVAVWIGEEGAF